METNHVNLNDKTQIKLTALILEAHIACMGHPEKYGTTLSETLKMNFDIDITFPNRDSASIFGFYFNNTGTNANTTESPNPQWNTRTSKLHDKIQQLSSQEANPSEQAHTRDPRLKSNSCSIKKQKNTTDMNNKLT